MSYIDWNIAKKGKAGRSFDSDGKLYYRDGSGDLSGGYRLTISRTSHKELLSAEKLTFGKGENGDFFVTTKNIPNVTSFPVSTANRTKESISVYGKDLLTKAIRTLTSINPKGDIEVEFNLKRISDDTFKFVDINIA